jgi:putative membrane protein
VELASKFVEGFYVRSFGWALLFSLLLSLLTSLLYRDKDKEEVDR